MIRRVCFLVAALGGLGLAPAAAQHADLRAALLYDHHADFAYEAAPSVRADTVLADPWLGRDKVLHAGFSFLTTLSAQYVLQTKFDASRDEALPVSAGLVLSLGLVKEIADSRRPVQPLFSTRDLAADAAGVALAVGIILL